VKNLAKTAALIALTVIAIGFGVPAVCVYYSVYHGFNYVVAGILAFFAIFVALALGVVGIAVGPLGQVDFGGPSASEREKLNMMRAHQRATLEELDDIIAILKEIRDILRAAEQ